MKKFTLFPDLKYPFNFYIYLIFILVFSSIIMTKAQEYTRGIGNYPGDVKEDFSPILQIDTTNYHNLALHKPAYQSSAYNYDLTSQLITDGIIDSVMPGWIVTTTSTDGIAKRNEREWIFDHNTMTKITLDSSSAWIQIELAGNSVIPEIDSISLSGSLMADSLQVKPWEIIIEGSNDGTKWDSLGIVINSNMPGDTLTGVLRGYLPKNLRVFEYPFKLNRIVNYKYYRADLNSPNAESWSISEFTICKDGNRIDIGGPYQFTSAWKSAGTKLEWVYVDFGAECSFNRIVLYWIRRAASGVVQISDDAESWKDIISLPSNAGNKDDIELSNYAKGRYVRIFMGKPLSPDGYIMSELEVYGEGGPVPVPHSQASIKKDGRIYLSGGEWKVQRESLVNAAGVGLSEAGFNDDDWIPATVPGTVLGSFLDAGALPDPNFGENQLLISDSYFYSNFWYRDEFNVPVFYKGKRTFINFDGINWKAEIYLNGQSLGTIDGAFIRGCFDVTKILFPGGKNVLAVKIIKNDKPGYVKEQTKYSHDVNGGELGADNPTYHASVGWDWMPTIRGRNIGIWNDVYLSESGPVTIQDPYVSTDLPLPDTNSADINIEVTLKNHSSEKVSGTLKGKFGKAVFNNPVSFNPNETKTIKLNPSTNPSLKIQNPKLWWPNGYGAPNLYNVELKFLTADGKESDSASFRTGIREMSYSEAGGVLKIWINGRRFIGRGGNWGFPESMLRYRKREYNIAVRYHKDMNFTMIRNWVGQTADDEFFDACDRYGIMIWQDFWLANPLDGPDPENDKMFLNNAEDFIKKIRNHPSIGLFCGRNEGNPPDVIDSGLRKLISDLSPEIHYISNSASGVVSGGGPYRAMPLKYYFQERATEKLHSEMGMPNVVTYESFKRFMPDSAMWPIGKIWGVHDFTLGGAQHGESFIKFINDDFGEVDSLKEWLTLAQWINYQGYRAMFEAQSKYRMGVLLWMSHPAWPSMVWQTYDYYFEPTAAYFACKKANEPLHIQWNPLTDSIEIVNYSVPDGSNLSALMQIINLDGTIKMEKNSILNCPEDSTIHCFKVEYLDSLNNVFFIRLKLKKNNKIISENFYWREKHNGDLKELRKLPKINLTYNTNAEKEGNHWLLSTVLVNNTKLPALMVRLKVIGSKSKKRILPVIYSDNYISLLPGEKKTVKMELNNEDTMGEEPEIVLEGLNIK
ncbi:MAG: sugar-binding domain-containing protein [Ignavibacteriaceae bacterium]